VDGLHEAADVSGNLWKLSRGASFLKIFMRFYILFFFPIWILYGCGNSKQHVGQETFQSIDFTYNDVFSTCFSIKFSQSETAYIRQHFASSFSDNLKSETSYFTLLTKADRITLDSFIKIIPFNTFDTSYYEEYQDGVDYQFYIQKDTLNKVIRVHSDSVPSVLSAFKSWILNRKEHLQLHQIDTIIQFESAKYVVPPPAPLPPSIKFKVPRVENDH
jgi:hypothetical protein